MAAMPRPHIPGMVRAASWGWGAVFRAWVDEFAVHPRGQPSTATHAVLAPPPDASAPWLDAFLASVGICDVAAKLPECYALIRACCDIQISNRKDSG